MSECGCSQHGDFCLEHAPCACGCQRHAHSGMVGECIAGSMNCFDCPSYRPAKVRRYDGMLDDATVDEMPIENLRMFYKELRAHHVEETTALLHRWITYKASKS